MPGLQHAEERRNVRQLRFAFWQAWPAGELDEFIQVMGKTPDERTRPGKPDQRNMRLGKGPTQCAECGHRGEVAYWETG